MCGYEMSRYFAQTGTNRNIRQGQHRDRYEEAGVGRNIVKEGDLDPPKGESLKQAQDEQGQPAEHGQDQCYASWVCAPLGADEVQPLH
jgi:hypothetical protein